MMVAENIPDDGNVVDPEEQKTILQNVRYFNRKELVQYVCHADDESREEERRALGSVSIFGVPKPKADSHVTDKKQKKNAKLVRFNSRPQIYKDEDDLDFDCFKHARERPGTPKPAKKESTDDIEKEVHFPPLKKNLIDTETLLNSRGMYSSSSESFDGSSTTTQSSAKTITNKFLANITHPAALGCSPPTTDSMLKRVLTRGTFGGSQNSLVSIKESDSDFSKDRKSRPKRAKSLRWLSPKPHERDSDTSSESSSVRSSSLTRNDPSCNRELMTSPLTMLHLRESMESGLSHASSTASKTSNATDYAAQYPIMTKEEHLEFIKYALSPCFSPVDPASVSGRNRATTISGGERPEWILKRRKMKPLNKSVPSTAYSSYEKLGSLPESKTEAIKKSSKKHLQPVHRTMIKNN